MSILHLLPPCALSTPLLEALEGAVCKEQLVPRPCVPGRAPLWQLEAGRDVFPAEQLQPPSPSS